MWHLSAKWPMSLMKLTTTQKKTISLSEALSLLVVLSNRFGKYYAGVISAVPDAILRIGCLIAGLPPEARLSGITQIIAGQRLVDADKID